MKCHLPVAEVNEVTIAVLPCQFNGERLGLLLHPPPNDQTRGPSRKLYYVSWPFREPTGSECEAKRLACLGSDDDNLRFRGKPVAAIWREIYIAAHPPTTGRRDGAHLLQEFVLDVAPTVFRIPRTLMQTLGALEFLPTTMTVSWDPASKDTMVFACHNIRLVESIHVLLGTCNKLSTEAHPCHWACAGQQNIATWGQLWPEYVHNCTTDHIADWRGGAHDFGDAERTIRLVFVPCTHAPERTLVLGVELVGSRYEEIQKNANIRLPPLARYLNRRLDVDPNAGLPGPTGGLARPKPASTSLPSHQPASIPIELKSGLSACSDRIHTAGRSSEETSVQALAEDLQGMSMTNLMPAGPDNTHSVTTSGERASSGVAITASNLSDDLQQMRQNIATHDREMKEMKDAYDAQICTLTEALQSQQTELTQLKTLIGQMLQNHGAAPSAAAPTSA